MKFFSVLVMIALLAIASVGAAQETTEPADVVSILKVNDRVSLREGPGGFMLFVLRADEKLKGGDAFKVHSIGRNAVALRYEPKGETDKNRFERHLARAAIISVGRHLADE